MCSMSHTTCCCLSFRARLMVFFLVCYPFLIPFVSPVHFNISSFNPDSSDIFYEGSAEAHGSVDLTPQGGHPQQYMVGHVWYRRPVYIWDSTTGKKASFSTNFSFTIVPSKSKKYSDGIAFFLAPFGFQIPPRSAGGYLGLFNASTEIYGSRNHIVMVEFDTFANAHYDPPARHIGINANSISSLVYSKWDPESHGGRTTNVKVTYDSRSKKLDVLWSFDGQPDSLDNESNLLSCRIDLAEVLPESVVIGFSASSGRYSESHIIHSWGFTSDLDVVPPPPKNSRTLPNRASIKGATSRIYTVFIFITAPLASLMLIISVGACLFIIRTRKNCKVCVPTDIEKEVRALPLKFSYQELVAATSGFSQDRKLGQGGSCHVYKGLVSSLDCHVAVKRIFTESKHSEKVFINEVKILSRAIHRNLVQFIGWCQEEGEFLLVYEYMPNSSLDNHLFGARKVLPWDVRYRIALGLASALNYLHEELEQCVLHRDIKAANILLDTDFNTKLGDFGVSKLIDHRFRTQTTDIVGTYGYLAPEYLNGRKATRESDIFSFGVVVLEIACGRRTHQDGEFHVPLYKWVWQLCLAGNMLEAADEKLGSSFDRKEMECLMMVGMWCVHPDPLRRPKTGQVIRFLQLEVPVPELPLAAYEIPPLYQPPALRIGSSCSSCQESNPQDNTLIFEAGRG